VDFVSPVPRPHQRFRRCCNRWMAISRHPGPVCRAHPAFRASDHDLRRSFRPLTTPAALTADTLTELDFCSLAPAAFFEARLTSVFETRCRLPTSATTYTTCGQPNPGSRDPCWDEGLDLLPVLPGHDTLFRGQRPGASRATSSEDRPSVGSVPVTRACPTVMRSSPPHHRDFRRDA